ncbi:signal recognition particle protein [Candidatus Sneabacter namystus]|uniref:signal recognition particle protein n=1 Tax=Candidatus Sneabacter namystus TaxID=2601646 RepID=UPI00155AE07C|nr:signal recognition particle receptor subunit alpha [Candidatus Sneabacter namystus]
MFKFLTTQLVSSIASFIKRGKVSQGDLDVLLLDIENILLECDVALDVAEYLIAQIKNKCLESNLLKKSDIATELRKIFREELILLLSDGEERKWGQRVGKMSIFLVGPQGSGKTTTAAKLALYLKNLGKSVLLVSLDVYRPAAREQLNLLAKDISVDCFEYKGRYIHDIENNATEKSKGYDVVLYDTAGCSSSDIDMMNEIQKLCRRVCPTDIIFVADSMMGQSAVKVSKGFLDYMNITGSILTKSDSDTRGGAILSIRYTTGKPLLFFGTGEKLQDLEKFNADSVAARILDMGDIDSLWQKAQNTLGNNAIEKGTKKLLSGVFTLEDYVEHIANIKKMGGAKKLASFLPGASSRAAEVSLEEGILSKHTAIVSSMTKKERVSPAILNASRKRRIAEGAGVSVRDVNQLLEKFSHMSSLIKNISSNPAHFLKNVQSFLGKK